MKISKRESILIIVALLLLGFTIWYKLGLGVPFRIQPGFSRERLLTERLQKAERLIGREKSIQRQALELTRLGQKYIQHTNPDEWTLTATGDIARIAASAGLHPEIIKPGIPEAEDGLTVIPVQLKVNASISQLMNLLAALSNQLPAVRVMRFTMSPANGGNGTVDLNMDYLFPGSSGKKGTVRRAGQKQPYLSTGKSLGLLKKRIDNPSKDWQQDWTRLTMAFGLPVSYSSIIGFETGGGRATGSMAASNPILLGIVSRGDETQALIQLGKDAWYLSPGEAKSGIRVTAIHEGEVTVSYQGRTVRLKIN